MDRILVVDEPLIADTLRLRLGGEGYEVETASSTDSAILHMARCQFALALVGRIPEGDPVGGEPLTRLHLLRLLKGKDPSLEVIIMTGNPSSAVATEAVKQGAFYFLYKPFDLEEMLALVGKALERRSLVAENSDLRRKLAEQSGTGPSAKGE